jgi:hypothetical protein
MAIRMISKGHLDIWTTPLGEFAFRGDVAAVKAALEEGVDWSIEGTEMLHGALYGGHSLLARMVVGADSPVTDESYAIAFQHCYEALAAFPPRPDLIARLSAEQRQHRFCWALVEGAVDTVRKLLEEGVELEAPLLLTYGMGTLRPIHYAARGANVEVIRLVVAAGADVNTLTDDGKSPLRLVAESAGATRAQRRAAYALLESRGARLLPEPAFPGRRLMARWGLWLEPLHG